MRTKLGVTAKMQTDFYWVREAESMLPRGKGLLSREKPGINHEKIMALWDVVSLNNTFLLLHYALPHATVTHKKLKRKMLLCS